MKNNNHLLEAINTIFNAHENFIIIGLTGRTGSGCSTVADILETPSFNALSFKKPKEHSYNYNYERKEAIIYKYAMKHWGTGFTKISMTDIISSFLFQNKIKDILNFIKKIGIAIKIDNITEINFDRKEICKCFKNVSHEINDICEKLKDCIDVDNKLIENKKIYPETIDLLLKISKLTDRIKNEIKGKKLTYSISSKNIETDVYTFFYQVFGNDIRSSGNALNPVPTGKNIFDLSKRTNAFIKAFRRNNKPSEPTLIVLDAIRNSFESQYFKDRYSAYYLVSVNTSDDERIRRLSLNMSKKQIEGIDFTEENKGKRPIYNQNIAECIQAADIHINNPYSNIEEKYFLTYQIVKYVMLMKHPGLITPTHVERCMQLAYNAKANSGCISRQVGAIITDADFSVKAIGWNDVPKGQVPCSLRDLDTFCTQKDVSSYSKYELTNEQFCKKMHELHSETNFKNFNGRSHPYCFKSIYNSINEDNNQVYTRALHAEENAFLQLSKYCSGGIKDGYLFTTASPCELCSKKSLSVGN